MGQINTSKVLSLVIRRNAFELFACIIIVAILAKSALTIYSPTEHKAQMTGVLNIYEVLKGEVITHYSYHGEMPNSADIPLLSKYIEAPDDYYSFSNVEIADGAITFTLKEEFFEVANSKITFRPAYQEQYPSGTIIWLCGYQETPSNFFTTAKNYSSVNMAFLPPNCIGKI